MIKLTPLESCVTDKNNRSVTWQRDAEGRLTHLSLRIRYMTLLKRHVPRKQFR